jgi:hypothetical protein
MALNKVVRLTGNPKLHEGRFLKLHDGLVIYYTEHRPKTAAGRPRVYVSARPALGPKKWRSTSVRTSPHTSDVMFERMDT